MTSPYFALLIIVAGSALMGASLRQAEIDKNFPKWCIPAQIAIISLNIYIVVRALL